MFEKLTRGEGAGFRGRDLPSVLRLSPRPEPGRAVLFLTALPTWQAEEGGWCPGCRLVLDNLSVTALDFHTVPDGVAPHSHRHPCRGPHPSRWSVRCRGLTLPLLGMPFASSFRLWCLPLGAISGGSEFCECSSPAVPARASLPVNPPRLAPRGSRVSA